MPQLINSLVRRSVLGSMHTQSLNSSRALDCKVQAGLGWDVSGSGAAPKIDGGCRRSPPPSVSALAVSGSHRREATRNCLLTGVKGRLADLNGLAVGQWPPSVNVKQ
ncbi:hypothetical protein ZWY2020_017386 [Hordeum vulgare]|nr:hypothetical protein ZWY2020_017386 [Hordeum vulgare]